MDQHVSEQSSNTANNKGIIPESGHQLPHARASGGPATRSLDAPDGRRDRSGSFSHSSQGSSRTFKKGSREFSQRFISSCSKTGDSLKSLFSPGVSYNTNQTNRRSTKGSSGSMRFSRQPTNNLSGSLSITDIAARTSSAHDNKIDPNHGLNAYRTADIFIEPDQAEKLYAFVRDLGKGNFGSVALYVGREEATVKYAVKTISRSTKVTGSCVKELSIAKSMNHPNIVRLRNIIDEGTHLKMVMELCQGGDLAQLIIQRAEVGQGCILPKLQLFRVTFQMLSGVTYMHHYRLCHRDIKPENYMLQEPFNRHGNVMVKLIDFGLSRALETDDQCMRTQVGTWRYAAPEVMLGKPYRLNSDMWCLGCTLFAFCVSEFPYRADTPVVLLRQILDGAPALWTHSNWWYIHESVKQFVKLLLDPDPETRIRSKLCMEQEIWLHKYSKTVSSKRCLCF